MGGMALAAAAAALLTPNGGPVADGAADAAIAATAGATDAVGDEGAPDDPPGTSTIFLPFNRGVTITTAVDPAVVSHPSEHEAQLVDYTGFLVTMIDTFDSNPAGGEHCQAGKERYVRLLNIASKEEEYHRLIDSCVRGVTVAEPPVTWAADRSGFTIHFTSGPPVTVAVDAGGTAREVE